jgi:hypothetical protein
MAQPKRFLDCRVKLGNDRGKRYGSLTHCYKANGRVVFLGMVPDEPRNDRVQDNTDFAKVVQWHGLSRPRRAPFRPGEVLGVGIHARALYRTCAPIELPRPDFLAGSLGVGFPLFGFLPRFRLCPFACLSFGHVCFAFLGCFVEL